MICNSCKPMKTLNNLKKKKNTYSQLFYLNVNAKCQPNVKDILQFIG